MALIHIYIFWTINETSSCGLWINRMTMRSRWKFRICAISNDLTLYSFSSLYIFVTWGWPTVAETCQPNKTDTKTVVLWHTYPILICIKHNGDDASKDACISRISLQPEAYKANSTSEQNCTDINDWIPYNQNIWCSHILITPQNTLKKFYVIHTIHFLTFHIF